jgi:hemolysin activation/secretion protein
MSENRSEVATLGFSGDSRYGLGSVAPNEYTACLSVGDLDIQADRGAADALTARSTATSPSSTPASPACSRWAGRSRCSAKLRGQVAFDNLDTSEKIGLGGAYGVRAYPEGEAYGDQGLCGHRPRPG